jgi:hypothetical protein
MRWARRLSGDEEAAMDSLMLVSFHLVLDAGAVRDALWRSGNHVTILLPITDVFRVASI